MGEEDFTASDYELINPEDFKSFKIDIVVKNPDTDIRISSVKGEVQVCELRDLGWKMEVPSGFCKRGRSLNVVMELLGAKDKIKLKAEVIVKKVERTDSLNYEKGRKGLGYKKGGPDTVEVRLQDFEKSEWEAFCNALGSRQQEIEKFFEEIKG